MLKGKSWTDATIILKQNLTGTLLPREMVLTINSIVPWKKQAKRSRLIETNYKMKQAARTMLEQLSQYDLSVTPNIRP